MGLDYDALIGEIAERAAAEAARARAPRESAGAPGGPRAWSSHHPISDA
jgi:hypothetical protein